jgi:hypothetical protein
VYVFAWAPGQGVSTMGWVFVALAFALDLATYFGRSAQQRYQGAPA